MTTFYSDFRHGSASWVTPQELSHPRLNNGQGAYLSQCPYTGNPLTLDSDAPITLIGGSGSGKGATNLQYDNLLYQGSFFYHDPKAEAAATTLHYHKARGKDAFCFNPTGMFTQAPWNLPQHKINPFDILMADSQHLVSDCQRIAAMLHEVSGAKTYFPKKARQWDANLMTAYALTQKNPSLPEYVQLLNMIESNFSEFKNIALGLYATLGYDAITRTCNEIINKRDNASEEYSGILSTIYADYDFMSDPQLQIALSGADVSLDVISQTDPEAVFYNCFPAQNMGIWNKLMRLIIGVTMLYQYRNPFSKPLIIIDEAAQLGKNFEELEMSYTYGRSFFRTKTAFQSLGQIENGYGKGGIQNFLGSSQARIFMGIRDYESVKYISDSLGSQTIEVENPMYAARARHAQQQAVNNLIFNGADPFQVGRELAHWKQQASHRDKVRRPLMTPDEILNMPENKSIVFVSGLDVNPIYADRLPYFQNPAMAKYFMPNPYHV